MFIKPIFFKPNRGRSNYGTAKISPDGKHPQSPGRTLGVKGGNMIKKVKEGYRVVSEKGRNMGTYKTEGEAKKRLKQIEYFKQKERG